MQTVTTGSPRVLDPLSVAWYDNLMGVTSTTRYVNNMDIVPSFPLGQSLLCGPCNMHAACRHHAIPYFLEILNRLHCLRCYNSRFYYLQGRREDSFASVCSLAVGTHTRAFVTYLHCPGRIQALIAGCLCASQHRAEDACGRAQPGRLHACGFRSLTLKPPTLQCRAEDVCGRAQPGRLHACGFRNLTLKPITLQCRAEDVCGRAQPGRLHACGLAHLAGPQRRVLARQLHRIRAPAAQLVHRLHLRPPRLPPGHQAGAALQPGLLAARRAHAPAGFAAPAQQAGSGPHCCL